MHQIRILLPAIPLSPDILDDIRTSVDFMNRHHGDIIQTVVCDEEHDRPLLCGAECTDSPHFLRRGGLAG